MGIFRHAKCGMLHELKPGEKKSCDWPSIKQQEKNSAALKNKNGGKK